MGLYIVYNHKEECSLNANC